MNKGDHYQVKSKTLAEDKTQWEKVLIVDQRVKRKQSLSFILFEDEVFIHVCTQRTRASFLITLNMTKYPSIASGMVIDHRLPYIILLWTSARSFRCPSLILIGNIVLDDVVIITLF